MKATSAHRIRWAKGTSFTGLSTVARRPPVACRAHIVNRARGGMGDQAQGNQVFTMPAASYTAGGVVSNLAGRVFGGGPFLTSQTPARFQHHLPGVTLPKNGDILTRLEIRLR